MPSNNLINQIFTHMNYILIIFFLINIFYFKHIIVYMDLIIYKGIKKKENIEKT